MEAFSLRKVIEPRDNMPKEVREAHHKLMVQWQTRNDHFHFWKVGEYDYDEALDPEYFIIDKWAREHFEKNEELIILNWW